MPQAWELSVELLPVRPAQPKSEVWCRKVRKSSARVDQNIPRIFFSLSASRFTQNAHCGILLGRRSGLTSRLIAMSSLNAEYVKNTGRQACYSETVERQQVKRHAIWQLWGKFRGPCISGPINLRKCKSGDHALGPART